MAVNDSPRANPLSSMMEQVRKNLTNQAGGALRNMVIVATNLDMKETALRVKKAIDSLESEKFNLIIAGRFKNGKSTLMNALLGKPTHAMPELDGHGPMPIDDLPCTATLTDIYYSESPRVRVWYFDDKHEDWSLTRYLRDSVVRDDSEANQKFFSNIRQFELGFPAELCKSGVTMSDSPGLSDVPERDEVTHQAVRKADAAIVVYSSRAIAGMDELKFANEVVMATGTRVFSIINLFDDRVADERFKGVVWNKLIKDQNKGTIYTGQDFLSQDIYFVDARKAEQGKLTENARLVADSGLAMFETRLGSFLVKERYYTHMQKFLYSGVTIADGIVQQITQRRAAIEQDEQKLQQAYKDIQPKLDAIRQRREKLPQLIDRYRISCQRDLKTSFEQMIVQLRLDLPTIFMNPDLRIPSMKTGILSVFDQFRQKKLCLEAVELCNTIVSDRIKDWSEKEAPKVLQPRLESLFGEITDEVAEIARNYDDVHLQLTGWTSGANAPSGVVGTKERVIAGIAGIFVGDFTVLIGPAGGGWRSLAGALAGNIGAHIVLGVLGVAGGLVFWPAIVAGIIGSLIWGGHGLEERVKRKTLDFVVPEIQKIPAQSATKIDTEIAKTFSKIDTAVMEQVVTVINEEEQNIQQMMELNKRSRAEKTQSLGVLEDAFNKMASLRQALKDVEVKAKQMV